LYTDNTDASLTDDTDEFGSFLSLSSMYKIPASLPTRTRVIPMTSEIEFSIMDSSNLPAIETLLAQFEAETHIHVNVRTLEWDTAWSDLVKVAIYGDGPDVSEIGSTWLGDLVAMNAVAEFGAALGFGAG